MFTVRQLLGFAKKIFLLSIPVAAAVIGLERGGAFERMEWMTYDVRTRLIRADAQLSSEVAVILIDEASLRQMDSKVGRWPWPRWIYADVIEFLTQGGARAVVFDILFTEKEERCEDLNGSQSPGDQSLIEATEKSGIVRHAAQIRKESRDDYILSLLNRELPSDLSSGLDVEVKGQPKNIERQWDNNHYVLPLDGLYGAAAGLGIVNVEPDGDGVYRRIDLLHQYHGDFFPTLALSGLMEIGGSVKKNYLSERAFEFDGVSVPLNEDGSYLINFYGEYNPYSMSGIMVSVKLWSDGEVEDLFNGTHVSPYDFENKIVFIGSDADGLNDRKALPLSGKAPGVFIHASTAGNILENDFLRVLPSVFGPAAVIFFSIFTAATILAAPKMWIRVAGPLFLGIGYSGLGLYCFSHNIVLPIASPTIAIVVAWVEAFAYRESTEDRRRRRVRKMFSQYVSPDVLAELEKRAGEQLGGEIGKKDTITIFFSDIRGFTSLSESLPATEVVEMLNIYFSKMTDVVFEFGGTIDKFIGDAIMCLWGAPIQTKDHALKTVKCAISMVSALENVNKSLLEKGFPALEVGVGINTGEVVVGNIGSDKKISYTAIGDDVNLASRIEGLTKTYGVKILLSQSTYERLHDEIPCASVDMVRVKGKQAPIKIYRPILPLSSAKNDISEAKIYADEIDKAFDAYLRRNWTLALDLYSKLPNEQVNKIFIERASAYLKSPPPEGWDGVHEMLTK